MCLSAAGMSEGFRPLFVGDGLNDAPALAASFVSIAPASGSELAGVAASAILFGDDLETLAWSIGFSREVVALVRRTILTAAAYNAVGILTLHDNRRYAIAAFLSGSTAPEKVRAGLFADLGRTAARSVG